MLTGTPTDRCDGDGGDGDGDGGDGGEAAAKYREVGKYAAAQEAAGS